MNYEVEGKKLLFAIDRAAINDISVGDTIAIKDFPGASHTWTNQDTQFMESNPDDDMFLALERLPGNKFKSKGIVWKESEAAVSK